MPGRRLTPVQVAVMTSLHKAGKSTNYIANETGVSVPSVQRWIKKFKDSPGRDVQLHQNSPGRPRKLNERALRIVKREVEAKPSITARQLKERNPGILCDVSVRTIQRYLHDKLGYTRWKALKGIVLVWRGGGEGSSGRSL